MPTYVQSNVALLKLSIDNITFKSIVCLNGWNFNGDTPVNIVETQCGPIAGLGSNAWGFDVDAIVDTAPGGTQVSWEDILGWWNTQTLVYVESLEPSPGGTSWQLKGTTYITNVKLAVKVGDNVAFTMTLTGQGLIDHTP